MVCLPNWFEENVASCLKFLGVLFYFQTTRAVWLSALVSTSMWNFETFCFAMDSVYNCSGVVFFVCLFFVFSKPDLDTAWGHVFFLSSNCCCISSPLCICLLNGYAFLIERLKVWPRAQCVSVQKLNAIWCDVWIWRAELQSLFHSFYSQYFADSNVREIIYE